MAKRRRLRQPNKSVPRPKPASRLPNPSPIVQKTSTSSSSTSTSARKKGNKQQQQNRAVIPFKRRDRILLVGEGDLSFAASLVRHHRCLRVTATVLEKDRDELVGKYPSAEDNIAILLGSTPGDQGKGEDEDDGDDDDDDDEEKEENDDDDDTDNDSQTTHPTPEINLLYGIDATKPPSSLTRRPHYDAIIFNFPHVGGKSTDVNRQVRHNQSLLVDFFRRCLPALKPRGSFVVTLFEAEPYTLWNVRDLARHAGLAVHHSFAFDPALYPGYRHARTAGVVLRRASRRRQAQRPGGGGGGGGDEPAPNPWRGEDRPARSYVFRRKDHVQALAAAAAAAAASKKRRRNDDDDDEDDDD
ncbi:hypothetical protein CP532_0214 [Ophiocordyceps camponoti-leonardi (nom. inval.)]|nr:hypothetical protein CP532_0214 [Ophiocordyceps camponoti-leonardi (nom. inval.)]